jgi:curved DNA-binding protein CbpA
MTICSCGNEAEAKGARCARCAALKDLELEPGATSEEIKQAFHTLAKVWHPDRFPKHKQIIAKAEEKQKTINAAYSFLKNAAQAETVQQLEVEPLREKRAKKQKPAEGAATTNISVRPVRDWREGIKWREMLPRRVLMLPMPIVLGSGVIVSAIVVGWVLLKPLDAALELNPVTAQFDEEYKASFRSAFGELKNRIWDEAGSILHYRTQQEPIAIPAPTQQTEQTAPAPHKPARRKTDEPRPDVRYVLPFITAGLSKSEVIAAQGNPTEATETKLIYGKSELYFRDDKLIGWKIDRALSPIRVKLWPDAMVDPDLDSFAVGSTKNDVIVVEGTPAFFSEDTFGYGGSEVYFKNNRVVGWKNDPSSPLRIEP